MCRAERFRKCVVCIQSAALNAMAISSCCIAVSELQQRLELELSDRAYGHLLRLSSRTGRSVQELAAELLAQNVLAMQGRP